MNPRIYHPLPLQAQQILDLPESASRHIQVLRLQPGDELAVFGFANQEWRCTVVQMGRKIVQIQAHDFVVTNLENQRAVHLWVGLTANERMDYLIEKATELGANSITPIAADRSVLKLTGDRAEKRLAHWQGIAVAACEQSGRNTVPAIYGVQTLQQAIKALAGPLFPAPIQPLILSLAPDATTLKSITNGETLEPQAVILLSGPEGGWTASEEALARGAGFAAVSLGKRVLRADTAPIAALAVLTCE